MKILTLPVREEFFRMLKAGVKLEEYREIKPYWCARLLGEKHSLQYWQKKWLNNVIWNLGGDKEHFIANLINKYGVSDYTHVMFTCGYPSSSDIEKRIIKEIESITIGNPKKGWCPDSFLDKKYFIIKVKNV